jgi:hypothetical protein
MTSPTADAIAGEIFRLAHAGLDLDEFGRRSARALGRAVPFDGVAMIAFDPVTAPPTGEWAENALDGSVGARLPDTTSNAREDRSGGAGLLLLDDDDHVEMANAAAAAWLDELRGDDRQLPLVVTAVARAVARGQSDVTATARARTATG